MAATKRDRKYMKLTVKEMRKSWLEHTYKHDPLVGAVPLEDCRTINVFKTVF